MMKSEPVKYGRPQDYPTPYGRLQDRAMRKGGTLQEEADEEGFMSRLSNIWSALTSNEHLPKKFRKFLKAHGRDKIKSLAMMRAPVAKPGVMAMQLLTAGRWDEFKKRGGVDEVYHTSIIINGNIVLEKLEKLEGRVDAEYAKMEGAELYPIDVNEDITIAEFLEKGRKQMGTAFYTYDAFRSNCQTWVMNMVSANGLLDEEGRKWIKQDIDKLIKELPALTKYAAVKITDVARDVGNVVEEFTAKRGGQVPFGHQRHMKGRGGF
jgi:hypothetical protein